MTKKQYIKGYYKQLQKTGTINTDWDLTNIKIISNYNGNGYQLAIRQKERPEHIGYNETFKGNYKTLPQAQADAIRELISISRMYKYCK